MMAGQYNEPIKIYSVTETINEFGERETVERLTYSTKAKIESYSGSRSNENDEIVYTHTKTIYVRIYVPISDTNIIEYDGIKWRITNIEKRKDYNDKVITMEKIND